MQSGEGGEEKLENPTQQQQKKAKSLGRLEMRGPTRRPSALSPQKQDSRSPTVRPSKTDPCPLSPASLPSPFPVPRSQTADPSRAGDRFHANPIKHGFFYALLSFFFGLCPPHTGTNGDDKQKILGTKRLQVRSHGVVRIYKSTEHLSTAAALDGTPFFQQPRS